MTMRHVMRRTHQRLRLVAIGAAVGVIAISVLLPHLFASQAFAEGSMYLAATPAGVTPGSNVVVSLRINPSTPVSVVEGIINYNAAQLQYVGIDATGSSFDTSIQQTIVDSKISIVRAKLDSAGVNSDALVVRVTFKALSQAGSSALTLTDANGVFDGSYTNPSVSGVTVTFDSPAAVQAPAVAGSTNATGGVEIDSSKSSTDAKNNSADESTPGAPVVSDEEIQYTKFTIKATTASTSAVHLIYGTSEDSLLTQTPWTTSGVSHQVTVDKGLTPGTKIFYKVVATTEQATLSSKVHSLQLRGFTMKVTLMDNNMTVLPNQTVTLIPSKQTSKSDGDGVVRFTHLAPGDYVVKLLKDGATYQQHISVLNTVEVDAVGKQTADEQQVAVIFDGYIHSIVGLRWLWPVGGGLLLLVVLGLYIGLWRRDDSAGRFAGRIRSWIGSLRGGTAQVRTDSTPIEDGATTSWTQNVTDLDQDNRRQ